jgi:DNA adenine methylase
MTAPLIKWAGGKTKLLPELLARMPAKFGRYYEPFCGGAALFFGAKPERAVLGDANLDLINVYSAVAAGVEEIIDLLDHHKASHCTDWYYQIRESWNANAYARDPEARAAAFLYLNRTCFNGLWRVNRAGEFNVPIGRYKAPLAGMAERLRAAAPVLARAVLRQGDYRDTIADAEPGDFVYLDSPYDPVTKTANFTAYSASGFGVEDQQRLAEDARALISKGVQVMLSNADTPFVRKLYRGLRIDTVQCPRAINSNGAKRGAVDEVIVTGSYAVANRKAA